MPELSHRVQTFTDSVIRRMTRISDEEPERKIPGPKIGPGRGNL